MVLEERTEKKPQTSSTVLDGEQTEGAAGTTSEDSMTGSGEAAEEPNETRQGARSGEKARTRPGEEPNTRPRNSKASERKSPTGESGRTKPPGATPKTFE